jgi:7,8-dihydroneopterin aldolase/epimerase/oxygenase
VNTVHVHNLRVFGHHGVEEEERKRGQNFLFDIELDVGDRGTSDSFADAVDYREVARVVNQVSDAHRFALLEALGGAIADELERRFSPERICIRMRKPEVRVAGLDGTVGVTVTRP